MNIIVAPCARWKVWLLRVASGAFLGCICRVLIDFNLSSRNLNSPAWIMTIAFLVFVPLAMGYLSVNRYLRSTPPEKIAWYKWVFLPWASVLVTMLISVLVKWEGLICLIFAGPIMLVFSILGGVAARLAWGKIKNQSPEVLGAFALPLVLLLFETRVPSPYEIRTVNTEIMIRA